MHHKNLQILASHPHVDQIVNAEWPTSRPYARVCHCTLEALQDVDLSVQLALSVPLIKHVSMQNVQIPVLVYAEATLCASLKITVPFVLAIKDTLGIPSPDATDRLVSLRNNFNIQSHI